MKTWLYLAALIICMVAATGATERATLEFSLTDLVFDRSAASVSYPGFEPERSATEINLAVGSFYIELLASELPADISFSVMAPTVIDSIGIDPHRADQVTSEGGTYDHIVPSFTCERAGTSPVIVSGQIIRGGLRYACINIYPVHLDKTGLMIFNSAVTIQVGERPVAPDQLLTRTQIDELTNEILAGPAGEPGADRYLIVAGSNFLDKLQRLKDYRVATGYDADIVSIDDVLSQSSGLDDAEKLREYLKTYYQDGGRFVLLAGDETIIPIRYTYHWSVDYVPDLNNQMVCDLYYADLLSDWNIDGDSVWGERDIDLRNLSPELNVGRLPFDNETEVANYIDKLIAYETNPGAGDTDYLTRTFFFSADQMRDYSDGGQHGRIASAYPDYFAVDTVGGVECSSGWDTDPTNASARDLMTTVAEGYGIVNMLAHGRTDGISVRSNGYNNWPKSLFLSESDDITHGSFVNLEPNGRTSFYYSLGCDNGGYDLDQPPMNQPAPNMVQTLLGLKDAGAVGFVAYSRWGWVNSSHYLQKAYFDSLFAHPELPAIEAMYKSQAACYVYRDLVYGQGFFGDPAIKVYTSAPKDLSVEIVYHQYETKVRAISDGKSVGGCHVILCDSSGFVSEYMTGPNGTVSIEEAIVLGRTYTVTALMAGHTVGQKQFVASISADVGDHSTSLPESFALAQNYPNPFNPTTTVAFDLPERCIVKLSVFNLLGQEITTLVDRAFPAGSHEVIWNGRNNSGMPVASGVYFYRLETGSFTAARKMVLLK